ncbi:MAG: response regulator transcription factor [Planctomycetes bacterium]|nr:response regulator transcription factor [Planctomycetota bacterium]MBI3846603.1 response regulator transcription factor [Planctomycetota bacterium]
MARTAPSRRILIVEDEAALLVGLRDTFELRGFEVVTATDGREAARVMRMGRYDVILLDVMLPGKNGVTLCRELRAEHDATPILFLTAKGDEEDKVRGLRSGGDDYVTKPFGVKELVARVDALIRRVEVERGVTDTLAIGGGVLDLGALEFRRDGRAVTLTRREVDILRYLYEHRRRVVSRDELLRRVWEYPPVPVETRTVDIHMGKLRQKIEVEPENPRLILTVRGEGYALGKGAAS